MGNNETSFETYNEHPTAWNTLCGAGVSIRMHLSLCSPVNVRPIQTLPAILFVSAWLGPAQEDPSPKNPTAAVLQAFETHDIVMLGEIHGNKQECAWLGSLVANPQFADRVDDIVMELGNFSISEVGG